MSWSGPLAFLRRRYAVLRGRDSPGRRARSTPGDPRLPRRAVLGGGLGAAGVWALGCGRRRRAGTRGGPEVAIVGAGAAGLACGWQLARAGVDATLYDARARAGGRIRTSRDRWRAGLYCELGGELIAADHLAIRGLCHALSLPLDDLCDDAFDDAGVVWVGAERYSGAQIAEAFTPIAEAIDRTRRRVGRLAVTQRSPGPAASIDAISLAEWLDDAGATGWMRALIEVAAATQLGLDADEQSALSFVSMFAGVRPGCFDPMFEIDQRFRVRGGNDRLTARLAEELGDRIELERDLLALRRDGARYRLTFGGGGVVRDVGADMVVLALPFTTLREVDLDLPLPDSKRRAIDELGYGTNAKLAVGFRDRVWRARGRSGSVLTDSPVQSIWDATRGQPGRAGILVSYTGGRTGLRAGAGEPTTHADALAAAVDAIFPGLAAHREGEARMHWPSEAWSRGSYCCYRPGQHAAFGGVPAEAVERVFFAGEHTAARHIGFMEGACESGLRAANEVLAALGLPAVAAPPAPPLRAECAPCG